MRYRSRLFSIVLPATMARERRMCGRTAHGSTGVEHCRKPARATQKRDAISTASVSRNVGGAVRLADLQGQHTTGSADPSGSEPK